MYWTKDNEKQVSHKYYRLHEDRRRFELGLRFYRSSFSYQCRQKNRYQYANSKRRKQSYLLLRKTSICPPYWNANSKALEPSLLQAPTLTVQWFAHSLGKDHIYLLSFTSFWTHSVKHFFFFNFWLSDSENQQLREETKLLHTVLHGRKRRDGVGPGG